MPFTPPKPMGYWEPPQDVVSFEQQLQGTPQDLSPVDNPQMPNSTPPIAKQIIQNNAGGEREPSGKKGIASRDESNNFGYMNKPGIVSAAGMLPGMLGMAGKAVNLGINANNQSAVSGARKSLGLPDQTGFQQAKGIVRDNKGVVSDNISIGGAGNYPVGFEALTPDNRTTMTPEEARKRSAAVGPIQETAAPETHQSRISSIFDEASSFLSSIFGDDEDQSSSMHIQGLAARAQALTATRPEANPATTPGPWGTAGNVSKGGGYGREGNSSQSVGPSGGGKSWGGPR